jgi:cytochrome c oxidase subunit II
MLDSIYLSGWGAFGITLFMFVPFFVVLLFVVFKKASAGADTGSGDYSRTEWMWLGFVSVFFVVVNIASIGYMPTVATAEAKASGVEVVEVPFTAESWSFDLPETKLEVGQPIRFSGKSTDTIHGFAIYHPDGDVLFTMMLMPGLSNPTSLVHTFTEPGTYTVRCLEYCGLQHHEMRDEIVVVAKNG